jgi:hypothetical protein
VVVFDEAQRAWTKEQASKFMQTKRGQSGFSQSEPEFLISVMNRHTDWCTVVCLIGGGQENNTGEAGLVEWLTALQDKFPDWDVYASSLLNDRHYTVDGAAVELLQDDRVPARATPFVPEVAPAREVLADSRTLKGGGAAGIATVGAAGVEVAQEVLTETQSAILPLVPYFEALRWVFIAVALIGIAVAIHARVDDWKRGQR